MELMSVSELANMTRLMAIPVFLSFVGLVVLMSDLIFNLQEEQRWPAYLSIAGLVGSLFLWIQSWLVYHPSANDNAFFELVRIVLRVQALQDIGQQPEILFNGMYDPLGPSSLTLWVSLLVLFRLFCRLSRGYHWLSLGYLLSGQFSYGQSVYGYYWSGDGAITIRFQCQTNIEIAIKFVPSVSVCIYLSV